MLNYYDKDYKLTKKIKLGKETLNADFVQFANYINENFNTKILNVLLEKLENSNSYRLSLIFEYRSQLANLYRKDTYTLDSRKEKKIIAEFRRQILDKKLQHKYQVDNLFLFANAFEPLAKDEVTSKIKLEKYKEEINCIEIWEVRNLFSAVIIFLFTEKQMKKYQNSKMQKNWEDEYFKLLQPHDEFGYFTRENFRVFLDNKENFDKNYQSNWYYYYK